MDNIIMQNKPMRPRDWGIDIGVALAAFVFGCLQLVLAFSAIVFADQTFREMMGYVSVAPTPAAYAVVAFTTLPVVMRRRFPWIVFALTFGTYGLFQSYFTGYSLAILGPMVAMFTIARYRPRTEIIVACLIVVITLLVLPMPLQNGNMAVILKLQNIAYMALAVLAGFSVRSYMGMLEQSRERAIEAERTREEEAAKRVEAERVRIAREIHDITAHSLSAVSIQAAAAERIIDRDPAQAKQIIGQVRSTSKSALDEIRAMVGVLRNEGADVETAPTEGTDRLQDLVRYAQNAGMEVSVDDSGYRKDAVPAFADLALYAIAREAVTNVVRHSGAMSLSIVLGMTQAEAFVEVKDNGKGMAQGAISNGGHGIMGMEERAKALHGSLEYRNCPEGGFSVRARIPIPEKECA